MVLASRASRATCLRGLEAMVSCPCAETGSLLWLLPLLSSLGTHCTVQSQWSLQCPTKHCVEFQAFFGLSVSSGYAVAVPLVHALAALQGAGDGWPLDVAFLS